MHAGCCGAVAVIAHLSDLFALSHCAVHCYIHTLNRTKGLLRH